MQSPIDGVRAIHNAFRADMAAIDAAALQLPVTQPMRVRFSPVERWLLYPYLNGIVS